MLVLSGILSHGVGNSWATQLAPAGTQAPAWSSNVIGIEEMHLSADYWVEKIKQPDEVLNDRAGISRFNASAFANDPNMVELSRYPEQMTAAEVQEIILSISKPGTAELFYNNGRKLEASDFQRYTANLDLDTLPDIVTVRFGMILRRSDMRTWPTSDAVFKSPASMDLDRFQENGLFPADFVAVLHASKDGQWYFVQSYNYAAWVRQQQVAVGDRSAIVTYKEARHLLMITGDKVTTTFNPLVPAISVLQLDMGVSLPLVDPEELSHNVHGQNPYTSYVVRLPVRNEQGELAFSHALIARRHDVRVGYLPYSRKHIILQGFKFLGERYGWGHSYNARDCTGLVAEIYKTFGILMPRNSGQQGASSMGQTIRFTAQDRTRDRLHAIASMDIGDLIYFPGHVMMYIGSNEGHPYVLHDTSSGLRYINEDGEIYQGVLNGVSVTPLIPLLRSNDSSYIDEMYAIKKIR